MRLTVMSFGFKFGIPEDANLVLDVRCLPNLSISRSSNIKRGWMRKW